MAPGPIRRSPGCRAGWRRKRRARPQRRPRVEKKESPYMKVAAIQMVSAIEREANLARAHSLLAEAAAEGAELAVLPEYFCMMGARDTDKLGLRETAGTGTVQNFLADAAREFGLWIVGGTLPLETEDDHHVFNSSLVYSP